jgi:hypothetical protein
MDGVALLEQARRVGMAVVVDGGNLKIRGPRKYADLSRQLINNKNAVIAALELGLAAATENQFVPARRGPGTETPPNPNPDEVLGRAESPNSGRTNTDGARIPARRLIGNNYPAQQSESPPESILATPAVLCPRCARRPVMQELREMAGSWCWPCWAARQEARS